MLILRVDGVWMDVVRNEVFPMVAQYLDALPTRRKYVLTQRNLLGLKNRDAGILRVKLA
jgi:DNA-directed RNA polymerase specialized sigma24 family protein